MNLASYRPQISEAVGSAVGNFIDIKNKQEQMGLLRQETQRENIRMGLLQAQGQREQKKFEQEQELFNTPIKVKELFSQNPPSEYQTLGIPNLSDVGQNTQNTLMGILKSMPDVIQKNKITGEEEIPLGKLKIVQDQLKQSLELKTELTKEEYGDTSMAISQAEDEYSQMLQSQKVLKPEVIAQQ